MNLRDLGPWLIPPLALFAASVPRLNSVTQIAANAATLNNIHTGAPQSAAEVPSSGTVTEPSGSHSQKQLDHYDDDARNLLWKFVNTRKLPQHDDRKVALTLKTTDADGKIQVDEHLDSSVAADDPVGADIVLDEEDQSRRSSVPDVPPDRELGAYLEPFDVKFLIVTLPDPVDSHLQFDFDNALEALQAAIDQFGYSRDLFFLPWTEQTKASSSQTSDAATKPGLILFRGHCANTNECGNKPNKLLMVFIVGESPTDGVHKLALSSALEQVAELSVLTRSSLNHDRLILNLLGPYFTGSTLSIESVFQSHRQWLIEEAPPEGFQVRVISGSAAAVDRYDFSDRLGWNRDLPKVHFDLFSATIDYTPTVTDDFLSYLQDHLHGSLERVAILRESDTGYGQNIKQKPNPFQGLSRYLNERLDQAATTPDREQLRAVTASLRIYLERLLNSDFNQFRRILDQSPESFDKGNPFSKLNITDAATEYYQQSKGANPAAAPEMAEMAQKTYEGLADDWHKQYRLERYIDIPFPSHISEVRGVREAQLATQPSLSFDPQSHFFFPVLTEGDEGKDTVPSFSPLDNATAEQVMADVLATLTHNKVEYVGILATDDRDTIYLAEEIHRNCPNITVFTFGGNLLFLSPEFGTDLRGMLVASTYPVFTLNQRWTYPWRRDSIRHFPDETAEGVYNAALALLGKSSTLLEYAVPFSHPDNDGPPIWISAVGKHNLVPVAVRRQDLLGALYLEDQKSDKIQAQPPSGLPGFMRPWTATALFWGSTAFCVLFAFFSLWPCRSGLGAAWRVFAPTPSVRRLAALAAFWASLLLCYFLVAGLVLCPWFAACKDCAWATPLLANLWWVAFLVILAIGPIRGWLLRQMPARIAVLCRLGFEKSLACLFKPPAAQLIHQPNSMGLPASQSSLHYLPHIVRRIFRKWPLTLELLSDVLKLILAVTILLLAVCYFHFLTSTGAAEDPFALASNTLSALRYGDLSSGVSPFLPLFFIALGLLVWCASNVRRIAMLEAMGSSCDSANYPSDIDKRSFLGFDRGGSLDLAPLENRIQMLLSSCSLRNPAAPFIMLFVGAVLAIVLFDPPIFESLRSPASLFHAIIRTPPVPSIEGGLFDWLFAVLLLTVGIALAMNMLRFVSVWRALRRLLRRVAWHPLHKACAQLGELNHEGSGENKSTADSPKPDNARSFIPQVSLTSTMPTFTGLVFSVEKAAKMIQCTKEAAADAAKRRQHLGGAQTPSRKLLGRLSNYEGHLLRFCRQARANLQKALDFDTSGDLRESQNCKLNTQRALASLSGYTAHVLEPAWEAPDNTFAASADIQCECRLSNYEGYLLRFCRQARANLQKALDADTSGDLRESQNCKLNTQRALASLSGYTAHVLEPAWEAPDNTFAASADIQCEWRTAASLFLASRILDYSRYILAQLRNLVGFSTAGLLLMLMAVSSYPFPHSENLLRVGWMLLLAAVALGVWIFIQINRDETLSLLRGGTPGKIDWNGAFIAHLALYALLPMVALLGIQFPATLNGIVHSIAAVLPTTGH